MAIETPEYKLISKQEGFEVRRYSDMVIATTKVQADYKNSTTSGFRSQTIFLAAMTNR